MKNLLKIVSTVAILLFSVQSSKASHFAAADIYYEYVGPLQYKIHLKLYGDCTGIPLNTSEGMNATSVSCNQNIFFTVDTIGANDPLNGMHPNDLCANQSSTCDVPAGIWPGFQYFHYVYTITLPMNCSDWTFTWESGARNPSIANLVAPGSLNIHVEAMLNSIARPNNNSVELTFRPTPYKCVTTAVTFLNGPVDPDLDSIVFTPSTPMIGTGTFATFTGGNNVNSPLPNASGYVVNPSTGAADFIPTVAGNYVLAFKAEEYDVNTGIKIGSVMRDVQVAILNCVAPPPLALNLTNIGPPSVLISQTPAVLSVCPGQTFSFDVDGNSPSLTNIITTFANNAISCPGSTYTSNPLAGGNPVTGTFSWTPTGADIGQHTLIITFADSTCNVNQPIVLKAYKVVLINVLPGVDAGPDKFFCLGGDSVSLDATGPSSIPTWNWTDNFGVTPPNGMTLAGSNTKNPMVAPTVTTTYVLHAGAQFACSAISDTLVTITVVPGATMEYATPLTICANDSILLTGVTPSGGINPAPVPASTFAWSPLTSNSTQILSDSTIQNPWAKPLTSTNYIVKYVDGFGCKYTDTVDVQVNGARPVLNVASSDDTVCPNFPFQLFANATSQACGLSFFPCSNAYTIKTVGTGAIQQLQYSPYLTESYTTDYRIEMIYTAEELKNAGVTAGNISSIAFSVLAKASDTVRNFKIRMGCTALNDFAGSQAFVGGLSPVFSANKYYSVLGWNTHNFPTPFFWDGVSNVIVDICYNTDYGFNPNTDNIISSNTPGIQVLAQSQGFASGDACAMASNGPSISNVRPNTRFKNCESGTFNYTWTPGSSLNDATAPSPVSNGVLSTQTFNVTVVSSTNANCAANGSVKVAVDNSNNITATASPQILCEPGLTSLTGTPIGTAPKYDCGEQNVNCLAPFNYYVLGNQAAGSSNTNLTPLSGYTKGQRSQMIYTATELNAMGLTKGKVQELAMFVETKQSTSGFNLNIKMGCVGINQLASFYNANELKQVYSNTNYNTVLGWNSFPLQQEYVWDGISNLLVEICFFNTQNVSADAVYATLTTPLVQFYTQTSNFGGCDIPLVSGVNTPIATQLRPDMRFSICDLPIKPWEFVWTPPLYVYDSTAATTTAYVTNTTMYSVSTIGGNKCKVEDSVLVTLSTHGLEVFPADTNICFGDKILARSFSSGNAPSYTLLWTSILGNASEFSCTNCESPIITPLFSGLNQYICTRTDAYGCSDIDTVVINTFPIPNVVISNGDSVTIKYTQELNLAATGALLYNWYPVWGVSNPNINNPIVSPAESTMYYVVGLNAQGCRNIDSIYVTVDYNTVPFVPSAFSPNADGKNDIFKVINYTTQKIQEFRVFNRWGEEIFTANDNRGWDGSFKGKNQDGNTFFYLIRLAYPDGKVETYKGDVTLIR
jgi:gliding motility-associated-like protein